MNNAIISKLSEVLFLSDKIRKTSCRFKSVFAVRREGNAEVILKLRYDGKIIEAASAEIGKEIRIRMNIAERQVKGG